jgi:hypothetical protein
MDGFIGTLEQIGSNPNVMRWAGLIVLALLGFGFMRLRRHPMGSSIAFAAGILGIGVVLSLIKFFLA